MRRALCLALLLAAAPAGAAGHEQLEELMRQGYYPEAARLLRQALQANPKDAAAHKLLGACLIQLDDPDGAVAEYQRFLDLAPNHPEAAPIQEMVRAYTRQGEKPEPAPAAARARPAEPPHIPAREQRLSPGDAHKPSLTLRLEADQLIQQGRCEEAIPKLRQVLVIDAKDAGSHKTLGECLNMTGRQDEAAGEFRAFLDLSPNSLDAPRLRALVNGLERRHQARPR